jgi:hypothetical protein
MLLRPIIEPMFKHAGSKRAKSMRTAAPVVIAYMLWAAWPPCACAQEADSALPGWLVTSQALESKITETEAATDRNEEAKTKLIELYRKGLSNVQAAKENAASVPMRSASAAIASGEGRR